MIFRQFSALGLSFLSAVSSVALLGVSAYIIAAASLRPELYVLALPITMVRACGILRAVLRYGERYVAHGAAFAWAERVNLRLFRCLVRLLPLCRASAGENQGTFVQRLNTEAQEQRDFYLRGVMPLSVNFWLSAAAGAALYLTGGGVSRWAFLPAGCYFLTVIISYLGEKSQADLRLQYSSYRRCLLDLQSGSQELSAAGGEAWAVDVLDREAMLMAAGSRRLGRRRIMTELAVRLCPAMAFCILFYQLLLAGAADEICFIETAVLAVSLQAVLAELSAVDEAVHAAAAAGKIYTWENNTDTVWEKGGICLPEEDKACLKADGVTFSYDGKNPVLDNLSFVIYEGEKAVVTGDSGSGKTTLFNLILGLWQPERGCFSGKLSQGGDVVSAVTQGVYVFDTSIEELFQRLCPGISQAQLWRSLELAQLGNFVREKEEGPAYRLGRNACRLSGGERQRLLTALAAARAIRTGAELLLLDEPTCGLDRQTAAAMLEGLLAAFADRTLLVITHDAYVAEMFNKKIVL